MSLAVGSFLLSGLLSCKESDNDNPDGTTGKEIGKAQNWITRGSKAKLFSKEADISIKDTLMSPFPVVTIDTTITFQEIEGFGAALTGSSAFLFNRQLSVDQRNVALRDLFDPEEGIGISYLRLTMGASDFSLSDFSYDDMPSGETDFSLDHFSLGQDLEDVVPVLKEILSVNPEVRLMGTPWSPPAWMKTNGSMKGGKLREDCYSVYADYFVKYIQAMKEHGIDIYSVTPQNEPLYYTAAYPCMEMQPAEQAAFIKSHLGPKFASSGINTQIIIYDHNWDNTDYAISILNDPEAAAFISGSAFHAYAGNVSAMTAVHLAHPDKDLYFTEISGGRWATDFSANLLWYMQHIFIGTTMNWSKTALLWNLSLNQEDGPQNNGCSNCRGVITINEVSGYITKNEEYYALAHFSKIVRPGAKRTEMTIPESMSTDIGGVAFLNEDGSKAMVVCNYSSDDKAFVIKQGVKRFTCIVPQRSVVSVLW